MVPVKDGDEERDSAPTGERATGPASAAFRLCPPADEAYGTPPEARLVREFKRPTVEALLELSDQRLARLPGRVRRALEAAEHGELAEADSQMDAVLAPIRPGPGEAVRRRRKWLRFVANSALIA